MAISKVPQIEVLIEDSKAFYDVLNKETDFACVLVAASYLDQILASVLKKYLVNSDTSKKLLDYDRPIGTFAVRSDICYCLGLISKGMYKNLSTIGQIRNIFAHKHIMLKLDDSDVSKLVRQLTFPIAKGIILEGGQTHGTLEPFSKFEQDMRTRFILVVVMIVNRLLIIGMETIPTSKKFDEWDNDAERERLSPSK